MRKTDISRRKKYDFLIIGSGIAGLSFALKVAGHGKVCVITKHKLDETTTAYAQGGISSVTYQPDDFEKHINDTLNAGAGLCNPEVVRKVVTEAPEQIKQLMAWGTRFDKTQDGKFDLHREGGHSEHRILHHKDNTGFEIQRALTKAVKSNPNIDVLEDHFAVELITQHHLGEIVNKWRRDIECYGTYVLNRKTNCVETILSKVTLMATGGVGAVYQTTTNPTFATGDGIAMVYRAKGMVENMEFIQFHPTSLYNPKERPSFLITEAMRGFGGILKRRDGQKFMHKYDERENLAPRDIVARAIDNEMKTTGDDFVYLDVTHKPAEEIKTHYPNIYQKCLSLGIDITKDMIPVVPAAHYACGGIKVDVNGRSTIGRLYAAGECSSSGLHGGNRLASNSLLEAVVFADAAAKDAIANISSYTFNDRVPEWNDEGTSITEEMVLITQSQKEIEQIMSYYVGIVRSNLRLKRAMDRLEILYHETESLFQRSTVSEELCELRNTIQVGYLIIKHAQQRRESRGLHFNLDYPKQLTL
ncbi:L-aspartate oxidase [Alkaliflexus imshenetskii]|uniref:L-aspartate oxidase n=1 Tax=Alkaliflexus imshenetskii TaxID=286730 RepID=UPI00047954A8|nr:L-aspartate oxidase [Alkaliflexus imshenetskii]